MYVILYYSVVCHSRYSTVYIYIYIVIISYYIILYHSRSLLRSSPCGAPAASPSSSRGAGSTGEQSLTIIIIMIIIIMIIVILIIICYVDLPRVVPGAQESGAYYQRKVGGETFGERTRIENISGQTNNFRKLSERKDKK